MTMSAAQPSTAKKAAKLRAAPSSSARAKASTRVDAPRRIPLRSEKRAEQRAFEKALARASRGRVIPDLSLWEQAGRLGGRLTPSEVSNIIRAADGGDPRALMDLANECRQKDCHLSAVLSVAEESIAGLQWKLTLPDGARAKDKRALKWAEKVLRNLPQLRKLVAYLAGARYYGYDVSEIVWAKVDGKLVPADFCHLAHRRFGFDPTTGAFVLRDNGSTQDGVDFRAKWPNKFITSQPRANGDAPQREGLCRPLIWMTQFRVWTFADWLRTAELSWKPWRIGTYKKGVADEEDQTDLEHVMQKLSTSGWAVKSDAVDINVMWPGGTTNVQATHDKLINVLASEMSKCVLGQTETTQSSASSGYAQAKVHDAVRRDVREASAMQIAADLTRDLIRPLIELNFSNTAVPAFEFITQDPVDLASFADAVKKLVESELVIPAKWVRDAAGMPEPKKGEETIGGPKAEPAAAGGKKPPKGEEDEEDAEDEEEPAAAPEADDEEEPETEGD